MRGARWYVAFALVLWGAGADAAITARHALVFGNASYAALESLPNPVTDASAIACVLDAAPRRGGHDGGEEIACADRGLPGRRARDPRFDATLVENATLKEMRAALAAFTERLDARSVALLYYAGHAIQRDGANYLIPVDAPHGEQPDLERYLSLDEILTALDASAAPLRILVLDACRNDPFAPASRGAFGGLAEASARQGTLLAYATQPGNIALDGKGAHSPYADALLEHLATPDVPLVEMFNAVGNAVVDATKGFQQPWITFSPIPSFCLAGCNDALTRFVDDIAALVEAKDLATLEREVPMTARQRTRWEAVFDAYERIDVVPDVPTRDAGDPRAEVELEIVSARREDGQRITPAEPWARLTLRATRREGRWTAEGLDSDYLEAPTTSALDILAPVIGVDAPRILEIGEEEVELEIGIADDTAVEIAALNHRGAGSTAAYSPTPLEPTGEGERYTARLFFGRRWPERIDVYVEAVDEAGNRVGYPEPTEPFSIELARTEEASADPTPPPTRRWIMVALGVLAVGALIANRDADAPGDTRPVRITTPLP